MTLNLLNDVKTQFDQHTINKISEGLNISPTAVTTAADTLFPSIILGLKHKTVSLSSAKDLFNQLAERNEQTNTQKIDFQIARSIYTDHSNILNQISDKIDSSEQTVESINTRLTGLVLDRLQTQISSSNLGPNGLMDLLYAQDPKYDLSSDIDILDPKHCLLYTSPSPRDS